jgi:hypothetical protein
VLGLFAVEDHEPTRGAIPTRGAFRGLVLSINRDAAEVARTYDTLMAIAESTSIARRRISIGGRGFE